MDERARLISRFLAANGWDGADRRVLAGDASFRRYDRLSGQPGNVVLMDAPPPMEDIRPFIRIARHLIDMGYSAPEIYAADEEAGFLLLEDLGDDTYTRILEKGGDEYALYELAVDVLIDLHRRSPEQAIPFGLTTYGNGRLLEEAFLPIEWTIPAFRGAPADEKTRGELCKDWLEVLPLSHALQKTLVLRDYHVDNLLWLPEREGIRACGLLDFQDALAGSPAYDLMSLLEDARRDIDEEMKRHLMERYLSAFPELDKEAFQAAFAILGAGRHAKVIGIFTRLAVRDGKPDYLVHIPRVWRLLEASLAHPALKDIRNWFDLHMPESMRRIPPVEGAPS